MHSPFPFHRFWHRKGSTVVFVAIAIVVLLSMAALAVDLGYLYVVRGELQNAADSGALAGAQVLYNDLGTSVNAGANSMAQSYVQNNYSEHAQATVDIVERGHWSFATKTFTPNDSLDPVDLWNATTEQLDANTDFINAVRVVTRRKRSGGQLPSHFFAKVFGAQPSEVKATAVAYIGFAGKLKPHEVDQPIAICKQAITVNNTYSCGIGRMLNSGQNAGHQTAGWTNFSQPCETASASSVRPFVCASGNPITLALGESLGTTNGTVQNVYDGIMDCWESNSSLDTDADGIPDQPWKMTLPVIDCPGGAVGNCSDLVGAVEVDVVWIIRTSITTPRRMGAWTCPGGSSNAQCWTSFVNYFHLQDVLDGSPAFQEKKTIYFLPDCVPHAPAGITGGENFGILAKVPVLVK
jgi:hypothetical protein